MKSLDLASTLSIPKLNNYVQLVDEQLDATIDTNNPSISRPLKRLFQTHSKRIRPIFIIAVAISQGAKIDDSTIRACCAIELTHIASLVHDDIIDKADTRWGKATINSIEGADQAIIIGDYLWGKSFEQAASVSQIAAGVIGTAMTKLCDGQSREMADEFNLNRSLKSLRLAHYEKTASLFIAACKLGGLSAGSSSQDLELLSDFGENFGMAFQLIDDLMDILSSPKLLGKPTGNDFIEGIYTMPVILSLNGPSTSKIKALAKKPLLSQTKLVDILINDGSIERTLRAIDSYNQKAEQALSHFKTNPTIEGLKGLSANYLHWSLTNLVDEVNQNKLVKAQLIA